MNVAQNQKRNHMSENAMKNYHYPIQSRESITLCWKETHSIFFYKLIVLPMTKMILLIFLMFSILKTIICWQTMRLFIRCTVQCVFINSGIRHLKMPNPPPCFFLNRPKLKSGVIPQQVWTPDFSLLSNVQISIFNPPPLTSEKTICMFHMIILLYIIYKK